MFHATMAAAIDGVRTFAQIDDLSRRLWQDHAAGVLDDDTAQTLAEQLHGRRLALRGEGPKPTPHQRASIFPPRRPQKRPERSKLIEHRRQLAASGPMPPALAARFTVAELSALRIIGDEVRAHGQCDRSLAEIAARAGCGRTSVQNAIRTATRLGLLTVEERRQTGRKNLPNVLRVASREWRAWLFKAATSSPRLGFKSMDPMDRRNIKGAKRGAQTALTPSKFLKSGRCKRANYPISGVSSDVPSVGIGS